MTATLILIRHGQSVWNAENRFTGWVDVPLNETGWAEAERAGRHLQDAVIDAAFTSHLQRAITTLQVVLRHNRSGRKPIFVQPVDCLPQQDYALREDEFPVHLNIVALAERHYGELQGLNKDETRARHGEEQVHLWRRSFDVPPPGGESLKDTIERVRPYFEGEIKPRLTQGQTILIAAHGNSLRALTKDLEGIADEDIPGLEIPTGVPITYRLRPDAASGGFEILDKHIAD